MPLDLGVRRNLGAETTGEIITDSERAIKDRLSGLGARSAGYEWDFKRDDRREEWADRHKRGMTRKRASKQA